MQDKKILKKYKDYNYNFNKISQYGESKVIEKVITGATIAFLLMLAMIKEIVYCLRLV